MAMIRRNVLMLFRHMLKPDGKRVKNKKTALRVFVYKPKKEPPQDFAIKAIEDIDI